jgi:FMN phosphatase YigB (HAD superfamily)
VTDAPLAENAGPEPPATGQPVEVSGRHPILADRSALAAVCIDMGSVVVDEGLTWARWRSAAVRHLQQQGVKITAAEFRDAIRAAMLARAPRITAHAFEALGVDPAAVAGVWRGVGNHDRPLKYADAALSRLASQYPLVMVANQGLHARGLLEGAGLHVHFGHLLLSDEIGVSKPDERIFRMALDHLRLPPERVAMLGDRLDLDIEPARRLGMLAIRIRRGPFAHQLHARTEEQPHLTFNSLTNAARWLAP